MDAKREADELVSRCVALAVYYQHVRRRSPDKIGIAAEYRAVATEATVKGIPPEVIASRVSGELRDRFEARMAGSVHREFVAGFTGDTESDPTPAMR